MIEVVSYVITYDVGILINTELEEEEEGED